MFIESIMKRRLVTLKARDTIEDALNIMVDNNINGAPVVDDENNLKGMIVKADIYRFLMDPGHYKSCPVEWVMTKDVVTASREEDIISLAKRLRDKHIIAIPIVEHNKVIGIISMEDVVDYLIEKSI